MSDQPASDHQWVQDELERLESKIDHAIDKIIELIATLGLDK